MKMSQKFSSRVDFVLYKDSASNQTPPICKPHMPSLLWPPCCLNCWTGLFTFSVLRTVREVEKALTVGLIFTTATSSLGLFCLFVQLWAFLSLRRISFSKESLAPIVFP